MPFLPFSTPFVFPGLPVPGVLSADVDPAGNIRFEFYSGFDTKVDFALASVRFGYDFDLEFWFGIGMERQGSSEIRMIAPVTGTRSGEAAGELFNWSSADATRAYMNLGGSMDMSLYAEASLLGESFALLRPGLSAPVSVDWQSGAGAKPVFVMIGGTDALGLTADVLEGLWDFGGRGLAPIVVARDDHPQIRRIREILGRFPSHRLLCDLGAGEVAGWSQLCSVAVIACGTSIYEMAALDVPFVGLLVANNQRRMASAVRELWELPTSDCENGSLDVEAFQSGVQMAMAARKAFGGSVDFSGADRVLDALEAT